MSAFQKVNSTTTSKKTAYENLEKNATSLSETASKFASKDKDSIFTTAEDTDELYDSVESLVDSFNSTLKGLNSSSGTLNDYYARTLKMSALQGKKSLSGIGISVSSSGYLTLDKTTLKSADADTIEKVLGSSGTFTQKVSFVSGRVADNAQTNLNSLSSRYSSSATAYSSYIGSKYNLFG
jgi:hypothetical protein